MPQVYTADSNPTNLFYLQNRWKPQVQLHAQNKCQTKMLQEAFAHNTPYGKESQT